MSNRLVKLGEFFCICPIVMDLYAKRTVILERRVRQAKNSTDQSGQPYSRADRIGI